MRPLPKLAALLLVAASAATLPGCILVAAAAVGAGTAAYAGGDLEARLEADCEDVVRAAESALGDMEVTVVSKDATGIDGKVVGRTALDKKIEITVKREGEGASRIWVRVDTFGDESLSRQVLERIQAKL